MNDRPHYPWAEGDALYAEELNAAIANAASLHSATIVSLPDYGGKSDGVTDDSGSLNDAIAAALAFDHGGKVIIPAGRTVLASAIAAVIPPGKELVIEGVGIAASELYFSTATDGMGFTLDTDGAAWGSIELSGFSVVRGPTTPASANTGLRIGVPSGAMCKGVVLLRDMCVRGGTGLTTRVNQWQHSVVLAGPNGAIIENVLIYAPDGAATDLGDVLLSLTGGSAASQYATSFNVLNCLFHGGSAGIDVSGWVQGVFISNSTVIGQYDSIRWGASAADFAEELSVDSSTLNARHRGVYTNHVNQVAVGDTTILHLALSATDYFGIELVNTFLSAVMANNVVGLNSGSESGIALTDSSNSVIMGNATTNLNGYGILLRGTTATVSVIGNKINGGAPIFQDTGGNTFSANTHNGIALATGFSQPIVFGTNASVPRWFVGNDGSTESGGNVGNDFEILSANDAGGIITAPLRISRATGAIAITTPTNAASDAAAAAAGVAVGQIYRNGSVLMVRVA